MASRIEDLVVWQEGMELAFQVYEATATFPREERYGLAMQLRRCAVSIPSNIAEGQGRRGRGEGLHFLGISRGSELELRTQLHIAHRLGYLSDTDAARLQSAAESVHRRLNALMGALARTEPPRGAAPDP